MKTTLPTMPPAVTISSPFLMARSDSSCFRSLPLLPGANHEEIENTDDDDDLEEKAGHPGAQKSGGGCLRERGVQKHHAVVAGRE